MKNASDFLHKLQNDSVFIKGAKACSSDEERKSFLLNEGFSFKPDELDAAVKCLSFFDQAKQSEGNGNARKNKRYDVFLGISELDGKPINQAIMVDISSWGAKIESQIPLKPDSSVEFTLALTGEKGRKQKYRMAGKVLWASQVPVSRRNQAGLRFHNSLEQLQDQGKFSIENLQTTIVFEDGDTAAVANDSDGDNSNDSMDLRAIKVRISARSSRADSRYQEGDSYWRQDFATMIAPRNIIY